jgi:uncharacterized phage protein gp47/JayE
MTTGFTSAGYAATTTDEEVENLNTLVLANVRGDLNLDPTQPIGQVIAAFAERLATLTELGATVFNMLNPGAAEDQFLRNLCALTGTHAQTATYSTVTASLVLTAGTTVHAGATASVINQPSNVWVLTADVTNSSGGTATLSATFRSQTPGVFVANAGTLTVIGTPSTGWLSVTNPGASVNGLAADTNTTLRNKREAELAGQGSGNLASIVAGVLEVPGVISAYGFENTTILPDSNGLPGKAFRIVVWDGAGLSAANSALASAIWTRKGSGVQAYGGTLVTITDSQGVSRVVGFDRAVQVPIFVTCTTTPSSLTTAQTAAVKSAIAGWFAVNVGLGSAIIARTFSASPLEAVSAADATALQPAYTPPITDVPTFTFDIHSSPTNTANIAGSFLKIFTLSTANILVNGV